MSGFPNVLSKGSNACDFLFAFLGDKILLKWSALAGKNSLLREGILSFKKLDRLASLGRLADLLPLKGYPCTPVSISSQLK